MLTHKPFYFLRHGETAWNKQHTYQGIADIPLNEVGVAQATAVRPFITDKPIVHLFSSNLVRAQKTAEIVNEVIQAPHTLHPGLQEVNFGDLEGKPITPENRVIGYAWHSGEEPPEIVEYYAPFVARITKAVNECLDSVQGIPLIVAHGLMFITFTEHMGSKEAPLALKNCELIFCEPPTAGNVWDLTSMNHEITYKSPDVYYGRSK